ncbi:RidA family protein [Chryseobacterium sp. EZn1]|uniref:RidA family protein n=1 Tax=Chryseobacterium cupriresistens TaxID=3366770 RepID=UPI00398465C6
MRRFILLFITLTLLSCSTKKTIVAVKHTNLVNPIGPYSHSIRFGNLIFVSGQIGLDQKTGSLKSGIEAQTVQIFKNLEIILNDNNSDFDHIAKTTIFITDMKQFETVNKIYNHYFKNRFPARSTIEIKSLPRNASIEIECIATQKN